MNKLFFALAITAVVAVTGCKPKDADVKAAIEKSVAADATLSGLAVDVKDGVATLSGVVKNEAERADALGKAKAIKGVKSVTDFITIAPEVTTVPVLSATDVALDAGLRDLTKDLTGVKYAVKDGIVTLTGEISKAKNVAFTQAYMALKPVRVDRSGLTVK